MLTRSLPKPDVDNIPSLGLQGYFNKGIMDNLKAEAKLYTRIVLNSNQMKDYIAQCNEGHRRWSLLGVSSVAGGWKRLLGLTFGSLGWWNNQVTPQGPLDACNRRLLFHSTREPVYPLDQEAIVGM